ncbi:MAG: cell division protein FtsZ [Bacteroidales bacterium]|jgi:cell division protein FtsZ|nr:cell division protein FtsZ [Bacteroidales bacterium]
MSEDLMNFDLPVEHSSIIKAVGIGGGGNNAVNHMFEKGIRDVNFVVCNTDQQALAKSQVPVKVQIGEALTEGRGAGSKPEIGRQAAIENISDVMKTLSGNTKMVFITTGMGGGTGTGAAPVIAKACKDAGLLTIAVVTIPFKSEGKVRIMQAIDGVSELSNNVDSLLVINNEKLREIYGNQPVSVAFAKADDILTTAVKGIAEIITVTGYINVDFADVETVMKNSGVAIMGMGKASGENRAIKAIENALASPLLNSNDITGASSILLNISSGTGDYEITMDELGEITDYMYDAASEDALIIRGLSKDEALGEEISVTVIATGFEANSIFQPYKRKEQRQTVELLSNSATTVPRETASSAEADDLFVVQDRGKRQAVNDFEYQTQQVIDFDSGRTEHYDIRRQKNTDDDEVTEKAETILKKAQHIQKLLQREGFSNKAMKENIDTFEDVPAYIRRNMPVSSGNKASESNVSKFTLSYDENNEPVFRENNAYLNDNVD